MNAITAQIKIQVEPALVWKAWTDADRIVEWFAPLAKIEPWEGGRFELYFNPADKSSMSTAGCVFTAYNEPSHFSFQWKGPDPFASVMNDQQALMIVEVQLQAEDEGTSLTLVHTGWQDSESWHRAREWHIQAWDQMLNSLKSGLESGKGQLCCT